MKYFYAFMFILFIPVFAAAEVIPDTVYAVTPKHININNVEVNENIELYVLKTGKLSKELNLENGQKIEVKILNYIAPKRGKRNGYYKIEYNGDDKRPGTMRASNPTDFKDISKQAGIAITGKILQIPGFSQAVAVSKGIISPNENQSRLQSAEKNLYESTPLTYVEKGEDFDVKEDGVVVIRLK